MGVEGLNYSDTMDFDADGQQGFDGVGLTTSSHSKLNGVASMEAKPKAREIQLVDLANNYYLEVCLQNPPLDATEVDNRRRRAKPSVQGNRGKPQGHDGVAGFRFATLDLDEEDKLDSVPVEAQDDATTRVVGNTDSFSQQQVSSSTPVVVNDAYLAFNPPRKLKATKGLGKQATRVPMVPSQSINVVEHVSTGKNHGHHSVTLLEHGHGKKMRWRMVRT
ncbi:hypothetical protein V6N12_057391 [Hibiscus sabdariffa]|uniref:Uncharacterized protein n=1 Tax=Hibiscus sabdariffa TaxID=183260 RepID=A0ABR2DBQ1_9ROSI